MMKFIDEKLINYSIAKSNKPSQDCKNLELYTRENVDMHQMLIGELEASLLGFLIRSHNYKKVLEIGRFTGYSALAMAESLPQDGRIITLDIDEKTAKIAQDFWDKSPHGRKITQINGPAIETLSSIRETFDLVFVDADKQSYLDYLKTTVDILNPKGMIVLDNVLWSGRVLDEKDQESSTLGIKAVNDFVAASEDLYGTLLPLRDGIFLIQKI